jgi:hypothetical protein
MLSPGEGNFFVKIYKSKTHKTGFQVELRVTLVQHSRDHLLIKSLVKQLGCGVYSESTTKGSMSIFSVTKFKDTIEKIIPFYFFLQKKTKNTHYKEPKNWTMLTSVKSPS